MTNVFWYVWGALAGLCLGSFLNVVVLRDANRSSIVTDRSRCPHCLHTLAWFDLIPVLSFLFLGGKCRYCKRKISWQYPLVEVTAAGLVYFSLWYGVGEKNSWLLAGGLVVVNLLLLALSVIDIRTMEIPVEYCFLAGLVGLAAMVGSRELTVLQSLGGVMAGGGSIALTLFGWKLLFKQDGIGSGDIWVAAAIGAVVGFPAVFIALLLAVMLGAVIGVLLLLVKKKELGSAMPFGPFLYAGMLLTLIVGEKILDWYSILWLA